MLPSPQLLAPEPWFACQICTYNWYLASQHPRSQQLEPGVLTQHSSTLLCASRNKSSNSTALASLPISKCLKRAPVWQKVKNICVLAARESGSNWVPWCTPDGYPTSQSLICKTFNFSESPICKTGIISIS